MRRRGLRVARIVGIGLGICTIWLGTSAPASATSGGPVGAAGGQWASCSKVWNWNSYGAEAYGAFDVTLYYSNSQVHITKAHSSVSRMWDCGPNGSAVAAYRIRVTTHFDLYGTSLYGCSAGYPLGFSCTSTTTHESAAYTATCSLATSCTHAFGDMYFYSGPYSGSSGNYNDFEMSVTISLVRSDGNTFTFQVPRQGVDGF